MLTPRHVTLVAVTCQVSARMADVPVPPNPSGLCMCGCGGPTNIARQTRTARGWVKGHPKAFIAGHHQKTWGRSFDETVAVILERCVVLESGCWWWPGRPKSNGYGYVAFNRTEYAVHRVMATARLGFDLHDRSRLVCHHCDNKLCCNPAHLYIGTHTSNLLDAWRRGRRPRTRPQKRLS